MAPGVVHGFIVNLPRLPKRDPSVDNGLNPIRAVRALTWLQQAMFWSGWLAWFADSFDFFCVSLTVVRLGEFFGEDDTTLTTSITLTLLLRSAGSIFFGVIADRFGRKWPLIGVLLTICVLQIGSGFVQTFQQFLAIRSLFGIAMGGVWGLATATGMENMPAESRGLYSGLMNTGYPIGYLAASVVNLWLVPEVPETWRSIFWTGAGISAFAAFVRFLLPESAVFLRAREEASLQGTHKEKGASKKFVQELGNMLKTYWARIVFGVMIMTGFNFFSHGSQDLYVVFMQRSKGFTSAQATRANIVGECGAVLGSVIGGFVSQFFGRRITMIFFCVWAAVFIPLWIIPSGWDRLAVGAFFLQIGVNGAWGPVAIYLNELSPPAFRGVFPGTVYQLGNMVSSAAAQIEARAGEDIRVSVRGQDEPDYGTVQAILIAVVAGWIILCCIIGPEYHASRFEEAGTAFHPNVEDHQHGTASSSDSSPAELSDEKAFGGGHGRKTEVEHIERV